MLMYNLTFQLPFIPGFAACSLFLLFRFHTNCFRRLGYWNFFLRYPQSSIGFTAIPLIRVPKARIDLATLSSKWVQGMKQYESQVCKEIMASNHFPIMQDVPQRL